MDAGTRIRETQLLQGWVPETMVGLLLDFVTEEGKLLELARYLEDRAEEETRSAASLMESI